MPIEEGLRDKLPKEGRITCLRETILHEPAIVRLGPPPDNAGILIRGGMAWVLGILTKPPPDDPRITRLQALEPMDVVMDAMWRELAYQWLHQRGLYAPAPGAGKGVSERAAKNLLLDYAGAERLFIANAARLWPGCTPYLPEKTLSMNEVTLTRNQGGKVLSTREAFCACGGSTAYCAPSCSSCYEE